MYITSYPLIILGLLPMWKVSYKILMSLVVSLQWHDHKGCYSSGCCASCMCGIVAFEAISIKRKRVLLLDKWFTGHWCLILAALLTDRHARNSCCPWELGVLAVRSCAYGKPCFKRSALFLDCKNKVTTLLLKWCFLNTNGHNVLPVIAIFIPKVIFSISQPT